MIQLLKVDEFLSSLKDKDGEVIHMGGMEYYNIITSLIELFQLQDSFQQKAMNQKDWWNVTELNGKPVDYVIAMLGEVGEGIDSLDFKWWSGLGSLDHENFITELVDALHFELSNTMRVYYTIQSMLDYDEEQIQFGIKQLFKNFGSAVGNSFGYEQEHYENFSDKNRLDLIKEYIFHSLSKDRECKIITGLITYDEERALPFIEDLFKSLYYLFELANAYGVSYETLVTRYKLKNALNHVRKMNGYKEGTYAKMWISPMGIIGEDNKIALELIAGKDLTFAELIEELNFYYNDTVIESISNQK